MYTPEELRVGNPRVSLLDPENADVLDRGFRFSEEAFPNDRRGFQTECENLEAAVIPDDDRVRFRSFILTAIRTARGVENGLEEIGMEDGSEPIPATTLKTLLADTYESVCEHPDLDLRQDDGRVAQSMLRGYWRFRHEFERVVIETTKEGCNDPNCEVHGAAARSRRPIDDDLEDFVRRLKEAVGHDRVKVIKL